MEVLSEGKTKLADVRDLEIGALKYGQLAKMAGTVGCALYRVQFAIMHGALHCAAPPGVYEKLSRAQALLQEAENDIAKARSAYGEDQ